MKAALCLTVSLPILVVVCLTYSKTGAFTFAGGSDAVLRVLRTPPWVTASISLALVMSLIFVIYFSRWGAVQGALLLILVAAWSLSGRAIGIYPDGRIVTGWYFLATNITDLRQSQEDPELYVATTAIRTRACCVLEVRHGDHLAKVFVVPWLRKPLVGLLTERGFGSQTDETDKYEQQVD